MGETRERKVPGEERPGEDGRAKEPATKRQCGDQGWPSNSMELWRDGEGRLKHAREVTFEPSTIGKDGTDERSRSGEGPYPQTLRVAEEK